LLSLAIIYGLFIAPLHVVAQTPAANNPKPAPDTPARQQASPTPTPADAAKKPDEEKKPEETAARPRDPMSTPTFNGLRFRSIGPAFTSGRVSGFAVDPTNHSR